MKTTIGIAAAAMGVAGIAAAPAEASCTRSIVNRSSLTIAVSRDGGPWVAVPPHRAQPITYYQSGRIDVALLCARPYGLGGTPDGAVWRGSFDYSAIIDRCYFEFGDGLFEAQLGPGFVGTRDSKPFTLNVPRQGDVVLGPVFEERCAATLGETLRSRY